MASKASNQMTLIDLTDAYSVIMTNENHTFIGNTESVEGTQTTTTQILAMRGSEQVSCAVGSMSPPTGIAAVSDGKTPSPTITITATSAVTSGGTFTIPIIVDGDITINKVFSFAIAFTGQAGSNGNDGKGVDGTEISYQASSDGTTPPSGEWYSSIPAVSDGQYLWTRTVISYTDGTKSTSYSVARQGTSGSTGVGVKNTSVTYQEGTSGTTAPYGTWSGSIPSVSEGNYLWTRTIVTYTDDTTSTSYSVAYHGVNGDAGEDAISLVISSSGGIIFKNTDIATTLTAHVYKGGQEVTGTALSALGTIKWYKDGGTTAVATGQTLTISAGDISNRVTYVAQLES